MRRLTTHINRLRGVLAAAGLAFLALASSGNSAAPGGTEPAPGPQGTIAIVLTDAPADNVEEVNVHVVGLEIKPAGSPVYTMRFTGANVELLALKETSHPLTLEPVPAGQYQFIRVLLGQEQSNVVVNGEALPLQIPSREVKIQGGFEVFENRKTTVLLDFDAGQSLVRQGNGQWLLKPVILMSDVSTS